MRNGTAKLNRRELLRGLALAPLALAAGTAAARTKKRPNVVVIMSDDMGWWDVGCFGHPVLQTPHLDRLAREGMKLTSCYACSPWCSPSRAGLLTGRHPYRAGIEGPIILPKGPNAQHLKREEATLPQLLKDTGYATCHVGKWHLIGKKGDPLPTHFGFDHAFWTEQDARGSHLNPKGFVRNETPVGPLEGLSAQLCAQEAISWLDEKGDDPKPFFINFWAHEAHSPIGTTGEYVEKYTKKNRRNQSIYYGDITHMDEGVGMLVAALEERGLLENTFIFFMADNGYEKICGNEAEIDPRNDLNHGNAGPLRYWKGHCYEGGIRVPGIAFWPGVIKPGSVSDEPISNTDLLPTICAMTGTPLPDRKLDGENALPILEGKKLRRKRPLFWYSGGRDNHFLALRDGDWKLLATTKFEALELYNLKADIGEKHNLAEAEPETTARLLAAMKAQYDDLLPDWRRATEGYPPGGKLLRDPEEQQRYRKEVWEKNMVTTL